MASIILGLFVFFFKLSQIPALMFYELLLYPILNQSQGKRKSLSSVIRNSVHFTKFVSFAIS